MSRGQLEKVWSLPPILLVLILVVIAVLLLVYFDIISGNNKIKQLLQEASNIDQLQVVQARAADKLLKFDGEKYPEDGCAITLSILLQDAGIDVPDIFTALDLGKTLRDMGWQTIPPGRQEAGDVGSTCDSTPRHGFDHIYLVLKKLNDDEMIVVDNQLPIPHLRYVSREDYTPTRFFLRASDLWLAPRVLRVKLEGCGSPLFGGLGLLQSSLFRIRTANSSMLCS